MDIVQKKQTKRIVVAVHRTLRTLQMLLHTAAARIYRYINLLSLSAVYLGVQVVGMMHSPASNFRFTSKTLVIKSSPYRV